jgi:hypothetical protein
MSGWVKSFAPLLAAVVVLGAGTAAATKAVNGKVIKNGTIAEKKLSPGVRSKLNAAGPTGPQGPQGPQGQPGPQGVPGNPAPAGRTAVAQSEAIAPLTLDASATILALESPNGTGLLTVDGPSRLLINAQVNAVKTTSDFTKASRVACRLQHEDVSGLRQLGRRVEATMPPVASGVVQVSLALVDSVDVEAGAHDISINCQSLTAPPANAGVSFLSASVNVDAVPR